MIYLDFEKNHGDVAGSRLRNPIPLPLPLFIPSLASQDSNLVDPASSHTLVSKIKPCMSKYKLLYCETANGSLNQLSSIWLCPYYMDNRSNSRANTCKKPGLLEQAYLLDIQTNRFGDLGWLIITSRIVRLWRRWFIQISALSAFDGRVLAYHGVNG